MWKCEQCGYNQDDEEVLCSKCRTGKPGASMWQCPKCSELSYDIFSTCQHCGEEKPEELLEVVVGPEKSQVLHHDKLIKDIIDQRKKLLLEHYKINVDIDQITESQYEDLLRFSKMDKHEQTRHSSIIIGALYLLSILNVLAAIVITPMFIISSDVMILFWLGLLTVVFNLVALAHIIKLLQNNG